MRGVRGAIMGGALAAGGFGCTAVTASEAPATAAPVAPGGPQPSAPDVKAILAKTSALYASARSYRDEGTFRGVMNPGSAHEEVTTARFRTRWAAPARLRFDLHEDASRFFDARELAVWTPPGGGVRTLFMEKVEDASSVPFALNELRGVSHGLTGLVPEWLVHGRCRCSGTYELRGTVACGTSTCFELAGTPQRNHRVTLFVDTSTGALRKYVDRAVIRPQPLTAERLARLPSDVREELAHRSLEPFEAEHTVEIEPTFDGPIDDAAFDHLAPPAPVP